MSLLVPALMVGSSVVLLVWWVFTLQLPDAKNPGGHRKDLPSGLRALFAYARWMGRGLLELVAAGSSSAAKKLEQSADRLALQADRPGGITGSEVVGFMLLSPILAAGVLSFWSLTILPDALVPMMAVGLPVAAIFPLLYLVDVRSSRQKRIRNAFPLALDLLSLCSEAGMDFTEGMKLIANRCAGLPQAAAKKRPDYAVAKLFAELIRDIQMGIPRAEALRRMEGKTGLSDVGSFATVLSLSDDTGGGVAANLRRLSGEMRNTRVMRAEEYIAKAPVKMVLPIGVFLFPVIFLVIFGPAAVAIMDSLKF